VADFLGRDLDAESSSVEWAEMLQEPHTLKLAFGDKRRESAEPKTERFARAKIDHSEKVGHEKKFGDRRVKVLKKVDVVSPSLHADEIFRASPND